MLAIASTLFVVLVFDGKPSDMVLGVVVGTVVWGIAEYLVAVREMVPSGDLGPPTAAFVETPPQPRPSAGGAALIGFAIAACLLLAWLADAWDLGAAFVPGQFAGYAAASAVGGLATRRWERARGKRILVDLVGDEPVLYATD
jgi:hypothetical protein